MAKVIEGELVLKESEAARWLFGLLLDEAVRLAASEDREELYISTDHMGLYEKYGCEFLRMMTDVRGEESKVYTKYVLWG